MPGWVETAGACGGWLDDERSEEQSLAPKGAALIVHSQEGLLDRSFCGIGVVSPDKSHRAKLPGGVCSLMGPELVTC